MAKAEVPAETFPLRLAILLVATIPVPASPSGGQNGMPACNLPVESSSFAPCAVKFPAASPATSTLGSISNTPYDSEFVDMSPSNFATFSCSYCFVVTSIGNMPDASPMPNTRSPVNCQCT